MPAHRKPAHIRRWRGAWYVIWRDHSTGSERRTSCESLGATTEAQRKALELQYRQREVHDATEVIRRGGPLAYQTPLAEALLKYRDEIESRVMVRRLNPTANDGLSDGSRREMLRTLDFFSAWLLEKRKHSLTTGEVDAATLSGFFQWLTITKGLRGRSRTPVTRSAATIAMHKRNLRSCFNFLSRVRPALFPDFDVLRSAFKIRMGETKLPVAHTPTTLQRFLAAALEREQPGRVLTVNRYKPTAELPEIFEQTGGPKCPVPVSRLFLLLALLGCRLSEALNLRWENCNLDSGVVTVHASKTRRPRAIHLASAAEAALAPRFLELVRIWRMQAGDNEFVLPHGDLDRPIAPRSGWHLTSKAAKVRVSPQQLRQSFVSYCASLGVPSVVAAMWAGHSAATAERWYRTLTPNRLQATSVESAMGLTPIIERLIAEAGGATNAASPSARRVGGRR